MTRNIEHLNSRSNSLMKLDILPKWKFWTLKSFLRSVRLNLDDSKNIHNNINCVCKHVYKACADGKYSPEKNGIKNNFFRTKSLSFIFTFSFYLFMFGRCEGQEFTSNVCKHHTMATLSWIKTKTKKNLIRAKKYSIQEAYNIFFPVCFCPCTKDDILHVSTNGKKKLFHIHPSVWLPCCSNSMLEKLISTTYLCVLSLTISELSTACSQPSHMCGYKHVWRFS